MFKRDPNDRIGMGEVWSVIDSLREKQNQINQLEFQSVRNAQMKDGLSKPQSIANVKPSTQSQISPP